jgi:glycosyltransferase 2 family protein
MTDARLVIEEGKVPIPHPAQRELTVLPGGRGALALAGKLLVTAGCFWYLANKIDLAPFSGKVATIHVGWAMVALGLIVLQLPLAGLRWAEIVRALAPAVKNTGYPPMLTITAISVFFAQLVPSMFGEAFRVRMLADLGVDWRTGLASVLIDRGIGVIGIVALGFIAFLFSSTLTPPGSYRIDLLLILGATIIASAGGLLLANQIGAALALHRRTHWLGRLAVVAHEVLIRSHARVPVLLLVFLVHALSVVAIWALALAEGLWLPVGDAAALFTLIAGLALVPISIGNWGPREVGVTAVLQLRGVPAQEALFFSVSVGVVFFLASIPGALLWIIYSPHQNSAIVRTS